MLLNSAVDGVLTFWGNRVRRRGTRRRVDGGRWESALESLEQRTLLSAGAATDVAWDQSETPASPLACPPVEAPSATPQAASAPVAAASLNLGRTFLLRSNPRAPHTIYLDFNGHVTQGTPWKNGGTIVSPAFNTEGSSATFTATELASIQRIWAQVAEDFAPFNVNVTTMEPNIGRLRKTGPADPYWGMRVVITPDSSWYGSAGGIAWLHSFADNIDNPCFVFDLGELAAEAISHEVGHTLGLSHDGQQPSQAYYTGHGSGETSWAPIMGSAYYSQVTQWSDGRYPGATQTQDDLNIITNPRLADWQGLRYQRDDHANAPLRGEALVDNGRGLLLATGVIERSVDRDSFRFTTDGGAATIHVRPRAEHTNLDIKVELFDAAGRRLAISNPMNSLGAVIRTTLAAGTYFFRIDGVGRPGAGADYGYSDYGSLGRYVIGVTGATENADDPRNTTPLRVTSVQYRFGIGSNTWVGARQLDGREAVPWALRGIRFVFNQNVRVNISDLAAVSGFGSNLRFASFRYDPVHFVATWTLADPVVRDRVRFTLDGDGTGSDGLNGVRAVNGGGYLEGADYDAVLSALEGDVNGDGIVTIEDRGLTYQRRQTANCWADVNLDGIVDIADSILALRHEGWTLGA